MIIKVNKLFSKQYAKLGKRSREAVDGAISQFEKDQNAPAIGNHLLKGKYTGCRSIDAGYDLRIVFREEGEYTIVYLLQVGSHSQLYG